MQFVINPKSISESDVVVIGGGTAGVFAAISAAKNGVKTILVEKNAPSHILIVSSLGRSFYILLLIKYSQMLFRKYF